MSRISDNSFINIQSFMVKELKLSGNELITFAVIYGFSQDGNSWFNGSAGYIAEWCNSTKQSVYKVLNKLVDKELIEKRDYFDNGVKYCLYRVSTKFSGVVNKVDRGVVNKVDRGTKQSLVNNIDNTIDIDNIDNNSAKAPIEKKTRPSLLDREPKNDIEKVEKQYLLNYQYLYKADIVKNEKPVINWTASRKLTKTRIEQYGVQVIIDAVNKAKNNDFCISGGYSLTTILSAGVLSRLINGTEKKQGSMINQLGVDDINIKEEDIPF